MFENTHLSGSSDTPRLAVNYLITPRSCDSRHVLSFSAALEF